MGIRIRLRLTQLKKFRALAGLTTIDALATKMGVGRSTVYRILDPEGEVSANVIARLLAAFPALDFADLFEVITDDTAEDEDEDEDA